MLDSGRRRSFGSLLRAYRREGGLSQAALAERAGLGERAIQRLEADQNRPYRATVDLLAQALHLSAEDVPRAALVAAEEFLAAARAGGTRVWRVDELALPSAELLDSVSRRLTSGGDLLKDSRSQLGLNRTCDDV